MNFLSPKPTRKSKETDDVSFTAPTEKLARRTFIGALASIAFAAKELGLANPSLAKPASSSTPAPYQAKDLMAEFDYGQVQLEEGSLAKKQFDQTMSVILGLDENSMLRPLRMRAGLPAPGADLGGWYDAWDGTDIFHEIERGFAPGHSFGQWLSALARAFAITGSVPMKEKMQRLIVEYTKIPPEKYYKGLRYPGYTYDKLVCALIDAHKWAGQTDAFDILNATTDSVLSIIPNKALSHEELRKLPHQDESYCWDELYTLPENLYVAFQEGAGDRYKEIAGRYLKDDTFFDPLSEGKNVLPGLHAYSHCNALSSAMQAYLTTGSQKHLRAAQNALDMIQQQSFATGGWGPHESFVAPGKGQLADSLTDTHKSFETPCGAFAHFKLCRYLLRVTRNARYGDSLEQVFYNTILGAKPLVADGRGFYYSDYNFYGEKYYRYAWTCCTGSLPQVVCDYHACAYFQDPDGLLVNLYIPSTVKFKREDANFELTQKTDYPFETKTKFTLKASKSANFSIQFRIPAWVSETPVLLVNGEKSKADLISGKFACIKRNWADGDTVELDLPMSTRLTPIAPENPSIVALSWGPLALFAITDKTPSLTKKQLLTAKRIAHDQWQVEGQEGKLIFKPFTSIDKEVYSLYIKTPS